MKVLFLLLGFVYVAEMANNDYRYYHKEAAIGADGQVQDTPEVAKAKAEHFAAKDAHVAAVIHANIRDALEAKGVLGHNGDPGLQAYNSPGLIGGQGYDGPGPMGGQGYDGPGSIGGQGYDGPGLIGGQGYNGPGPMGGQGYDGPGLGNMGFTESGLIF